MQFFLVVHQPLDECFKRFIIILELDPSDDSGMNNRANRLKAFVDIHRQSTRLNLNGWLGWCVVKEVRHGVGQCFSAEQIGAVWKYFNVQRRFVARIDVGAEQRQFIVDMVHVVLKALTFHEGTQQVL